MSIFEKIKIDKTDFNSFELDYNENIINIVKNNRKYLINTNEQEFYNVINNIRKTILKSNPYIIHNNVIKIKKYFKNILKIQSELIEIYEYFTSIQFLRHLESNKLNTKIGHFKIFENHYFEALDSFNDLIIIFEFIDTCMSINDTDYLETILLNCNKGFMYNNYYKYYISKLIISQRFDIKFNSEDPKYKEEVFENLIGFIIGKFNFDSKFNNFLNYKKQFEDTIWRFEIKIPDEEGVEFLKMYKAEEYYLNFNKVKSDYLKSIGD